MRSINNILHVQLISIGRATTNGNEDDAMEIYRTAGKKAAALLDPFAIPAKAFLTGIQHDAGGKMDDTLYKLRLSNWWNAYTAL